MTRLSQRPNLFPASLVLCGIPALALVLGGSACNTLRPVKGSHVESQMNAGLDAVSPVDVAVAPVMVQESDLIKSTNLPLNELRAAFQAGLVRRRYSPLALEYVDQQVVDASYRPGSLQEDAVLELTILEWKETLWESSAHVELSLEARLIDASTEGANNGVLWSGHLPSRSFRSNAGAGMVASRSNLMGEVARRIADEVLAALPSRSPAPGPARVP